MSNVRFVYLSFIALGCSVAAAQQPASRLEPQPLNAVQTHAVTSGEFTTPVLTAPPVTPELWVYSQEQRRHDDPAQAVRRKAEIKADQRLSRLAAMKWYGFSNARPQATATPFMGIYSPTWVGNGMDRYDWVRGGYTVVIERTDEGYLRR